MKTENAQTNLKILQTGILFRFRHHNTLIFIVIYGGMRVIAPPNRGLLPASAIHSPKRMKSLIYFPAAFPAPIIIFLLSIVIYGDMRVIAPPNHRLPSGFGDSFAETDEIFDFLPCGFSRPEMPQAF